jgi:cysteine desulfurase
LFHTDAVQVVGKIPFNIAESGVDFLAGSAHKTYGPKGVGICYIKKSARGKLVSMSNGGSHEGGRRAGTLNVPGIVGLAKALDLAVFDMDNEIPRLQKLADMLLKGFQDHLDGVYFNGHPTNRLPGFLSLSFDKVEGESMLLSLDMQGIGASSGSACTSGSLEPSHVLLAMGCDMILAHGSLRFTMGRDNNEEDIEYILRVFPPIVEKLRSVSML